MMGCAINNPYPDDTFSYDKSIEFRDKLHHVSIVSQTFKEKQKKYFFIINSYYCYT